MRDSIFISYRKDDTKDLARHLADLLKRRFGEQQVFLDDEDIRVGDGWKTAIDDALSRSFVLVALIGPNWASIRDANGKRRLDDPDDILRQEVVTALRSGIPVISVCVHGVPMPARGDLPEPLHGMLDVQGDTIRIENVGTEAFDADADSLVRNISRILSQQRPAAKVSLPPAGGAPRRNAIMEALRSLLTNAEVPPNLTRRLTSDPFLRQDPQADLRDYAWEKPVTPYLPYVEIVNWCEEFVRGVKPGITVELLRGDFQLGSWGPGDGDGLREQALAYALKMHPKTHDGEVVRIGECIASGSKLWLSVQKASYFQQRQSNLALDYQYKTITGTVLTMRDLLRQQFGLSLPPLNDRRMANTLGIAALIMVREGDDLTPYLVSRSRDVAVFNQGGEWHCTASSVAKLPESPDRTQHFYKDSMLKELDQEVGILEHELETLEPVAFCREMTRGGKPQMFFLGITSLDRATLERKLKEAQRKTKAGGGVVGNTPMPFMRSPEALTDENALAMFHGKGFTIEAAACLYYFLRCRTFV
jgi:hypothetical protein